MKVLTIEQAASFLQMHKVTLSKKAKSGIIPAAKPAKKWLFYESYLIEYLRGQVKTLAKPEPIATNNPLNVVITPPKTDYLNALGISDCPQTHSPTPDPLRGARHARAASRVAEGKAVGLVGNSRTCHNRPADDVKT